ncbi:MAG: Oligopeptide ABC transporter, ATP-binding protein [Methanomicrobiales archaeon 53_19]|uniref:ABC transporter ATP-binding protein n=1 Tax=Methanocalculus sp. TaxID=2004547 RepID=UPI000747C86D|nr:ABC transporter ATP-binding protein [Methanocalculus sp.]KUL02552.1 MAG: Oligopeptide ABC transporter, ATP-binding protein [Methanomicrobiales archaeon 53_19]HIJ06365.1 ABC transporter ATP-binding protein [Methanocalculus sp.]
MLVVENLSKIYTSGFFRPQDFHAVKDVSFSVHKDEIFGLVGESGSGKTTIGKMLVRLIDPTSGKITIDKKDITNMRGKELREYWTNLQMVFQDPRSSLNPRIKVGESLIEGLKLSGNIDSIDEVTQDLLKSVNIREEILNRYPHEVSGGEIQRIVIARALSLNPKLLVADEPTSNLDMSVQAQVLRLIKDLQRKHSIPCILISHDIEVVKWMCDRIAVMLNGRIVEEGITNDVIHNPQHPYTQDLIKATFLSDIPTVDGEPGEGHSLHNGCSYAGKCIFVKPECLENEIQLRGDHHKVACILAH